MKFIALTFLVFMSLFGKGQVESTAYNLMLKALLGHSVPEITAETALEKHTKGAIFIDARAKKEFEVSHIKNAIFIGFEEDYNESVLDGIDKSAEVVVYCSVGYRSEKIAEKLIDKGFTNVSNLYGGIFEWKNKGYDVFKNTQLTDSVHAFNKKWGIWLKKGTKVY